MIPRLVQFTTEHADTIGGACAGAVAGIPPLLLTALAWGSNQMHPIDVAALTLIPWFAFQTATLLCGYMGGVCSDWSRFNYAHALYLQDHSEFPIQLQGNLTASMFQIGLQFGALIGLLVYVLGMCLCLLTATLGQTINVITYCRHYVVWWCLYLVTGGTILGGGIGAILARLITSQILWG